MVLQISRVLHNVQQISQVAFQQLFEPYSLAFFTRLSQTLIFGMANQVSKSVSVFLSPADFIKNFRMF